MLDHPLDPNQLAEDAGDFQRLIELPKPLPDGFEASAYVIEFRFGQLQGRLGTALQPGRERERAGLATTHALGELAQGLRPAQRDQVGVIGRLHPTMERRSDGRGRFGSRFQDEDRRGQLRTSGRQLSEIQGLAAKVIQQVP